MAAIKGQPAPKPGQLNAPVPGDAQQSAVDEFFADFEAPKAEVPQGSSAADEFFAEPPQAAAPEQPAPQMPPADQFAEEPGFAQANVDQFQNFVTRLQAGLAANDEEKLMFLQKKYGPQNALVKDGKLFFRRDAKEKFRRLDPEAFEVVNDIVADFSREIVTEVAMLPGELGGAAIGGGPGGAYVGRIATAPAANLAADVVAEASGVPQDPGRSRIAEGAIMSAGEAVLPVVGRQILKRIPGTRAYLTAKKAGEKELVALSKQSEEVAQAAQELAAQGRAFTIDGQSVGLPGADVSLMGHQLSPTDPKLKHIADLAASNPKFINAQKQIAEGWGDSARNVLTEIALRNNKGPVAPEKLGETIVNAVAEVRRAEGEAISGFKTAALKALKNRRIPLRPEAGEQLTSLTRELGFKFRVNPETKKLIPIPPNNLRSLVGKFGLTSTGEVRALVNSVNDIVRLQSQGGLRLTDLERMRNTVGGLSDSLRDTQAGVELARLSAHLRGQYRESIAQGLASDAERQTFMNVMDDYSSLMDNVKTLKTVLKDNASSKAVVASFFTGRQNLDKIKALKSIAPEAFPALKEEWVNQMLSEFSSRETLTGLNSRRFLDAIDKKYGKQFVAEVLNDGPGPNADTLRNVLRVTERIESTTKGVNVDKLTDKQKQGVMDLFLGMLGDIQFKKINGIANILKGSRGKDNVLLEILSRDGIDKYIANYPGKGNRAQLKKNLTEILAHSRVMRGLVKTAESEEVQRGSRRLLIDEARPGDEFGAGVERSPGR